MCNQDEISEEELEQENALVDFFMGCPYKAMKDVIERRWKNLGYVSVYLLKLVFFCMIKFQDVETKKMLLQQGQKALTKAFIKPMQC